MCGIFGILGNVSKQLMTEMSVALTHRGPDDSGFFFGANVALGNRRLSIIDVKGGHQPIHNEDSTIWVTFNGEIYNFQDLRPELERMGHKFYTDSDTEVIIHAYEEWGENCVGRFNGMWAFALWDSKKKQLFLSRDRIGVKPLFYFKNDERFIFASEIKAILLDKSVPRKPDDRIIYEYLVYGFHDHTEQTFFTEIKRLLPAHNLIIDENGIRTAKYWDIQYVNETMEGSAKNDDIYAKKFLELLKDSVRLRLISEVPVGTCLSGGLDSSSIVYLINQSLVHGSNAVNVVGEHQKTFTACFEDRRIDEREYVEDVIAQTNAERNFVYPTSKQLWNDIKSLVYFQDEPFMSSSIYAQWCVMKLASQKVKVVLDGQGADELLAGYLPYYLVFLMDLWKKKKISKFIKEFFLSFDLTFFYIRRYYLVFLKDLWRTRKIRKDFLASFYSRWVEGVKSVLNDEFASEFGSVKADFGYGDLPARLCKDITESGLPSLLRYEDRNSSAFSIEARVPFLDYRLIEYVFSLPITQRIGNGWTKRILRNSMRETLPKKIRNRRKKIGFETPEASWFRELSKEVREIFASKEFGQRKYIKADEILKRFDEFCRGESQQFTQFFWRALNLEIWFRVFIDQENILKPVNRSE